VAGAWRGGCICRLTYCREKDVKIPAMKKKMKNLIFKNNKNSKINSKIYF